MQACGKTVPSCQWALTLASTSCAEQTKAVHGLGEPGASTGQTPVCHRPERLQALPTQAKNGL
jgi:hypothetical protein